MLEVDYHKQFIKNYKARIYHQPKLVSTFKERLKLFLNKTSSPIHKDHALTGTLRGYRAFSLNGDFRVIYTYTTENKIILVDIGTHNQVY